MPYTINIIEDANIAELKFVGECSMEEHNESREEIFRICKEKKTPVLVNMTHHESFMEGSTIELFKFGTEFDKFKLINRIAALDEKANSPDVEFVVDVASSRGFDMQYFTDRAEAIQWLSSKSLE